MHFIDLILNEANKEVANNVGLLVGSGANLQLNIADGTERKTRLYFNNRTLTDITYDNRTIESIIDAFGLETFTRELSLLKKVRVRCGCKSKEALLPVLQKAKPQIRFDPPMFPDEFVDRDRNQRLRALVEKYELDAEGKLYATLKMDLRDFLFCTRNDLELFFATIDSVGTMVGVSNGFLLKEPPHTYL
jgi:hypothetical protein